MNPRVILVESQHWLAEYTTFYSDTTIKKMGQWSSLTFLQYIHNQIAHLSKGVAQQMSRPLPFLNIAVIEGNTHQA